jgi:hypothetical protein
MTDFMKLPHTLTESLTRVLFASVTPDVNEE